MKTKLRLSIPHEKIAAFCQKHNIRSLAFFGSILREDFNVHSDVDVLVEFVPGTTVGFFKLYDLEEELSQVLGGRKVDMNTPKKLSKYFRDKILLEAEVQYVRS